MNLQKQAVDLPGPAWTRGLPAGPASATFSSRPLSPPHLPPPKANILSVFIYFFIFFIFGCVGSSLLCTGFL